MKVFSVMVRDVVCISPKEALDDAYEIMTEWEIRHLPVLENDELVGILSDRDILVRASYRDGRLQIPHTPAREAMTRLPITCSMVTSLSAVGRRMLEEKIDSMPVVDSSGRLAGLITSSDLIAVLVQCEEESASSTIPFHFRLIRSDRANARPSSVARRAKAGS